MQPLFELEITNKIMHTMQKTNLGFYQRELSYIHCEVVNILEEVSYNELPQDKKTKLRTESLPYCNGEYLFPTLQKIRKENIIYASYAVEVLLRYYYRVYDKHTARLGGSLLEQLFSWIEQYSETYKKQRKTDITEVQLAIVFTYKLEELLNGIETDKVKQKEMRI